MKPIKWKDYLSFSKKERIALIILLSLILFFITIPYFYYTKEPPLVIEQLLPQTDSLVAQRTETKVDTVEAPNSVNSHVDDLPAALFYFDPNTLDESGWKKLGVSERVAKMIINYRQKGGRFRRPDDLRKIYGLSPKESDRLVPYVKLPEANKPVVAEKKEDHTFVSPSKKVQVIHINNATAEEWKALPGIGPVLSERIIRFRNKLDHFSSIDEVSKTYGLPDSTFQKIKPYLSLD